MKWTIACDFDGVIHQYTTKQKGEWDPLYIPDPIMPGAVEWLTEMVQKFKVVIYSARFTPHGNTEADWVAACQAMEEVKVWMLGQGVPLDVMTKLHFWMEPGKPTALVYIDDRGFRFEGVFPSKEQIHQLRPWKVNDGPAR